MSKCVKFKLFQCYEKDENGNLHLIVCLALNKKEAESKIHQPKWWKAQGIRPVEEFK